LGKSFANRRILEGVATTGGKDIAYAHVVESIKNLIDAAT